MPGILWKGEGKANEVHLTFDDGPIPEVTPWILDILKKYDQKATFFCVGDNVRKYPEIFNRIQAEGHAVGNHTFHHLNGWKTDTGTYRHDIREACRYIASDLFRPPYGKMKFSQYWSVKKKFRIVLWTYLSGDFDPGFVVEKCVEEVKRISREGAVLVFHDNIKTKKNIENVLPLILQYYQQKNILSKPIV